jgi:hypothetical protein
LCVVKFAIVSQNKKRAEPIKRTLFHVYAPII